MQAPTTIVGRIRLAVGGASLLLGSIGTLFGGLGLLLAWQTGGSHADRDHAHGAAMMAVVSAPILGVGLGLLLLAAFVWPRQRARREHRDSAA